MLLVGVNVVKKQYTVLDKLPLPLPPLPPSPPAPLTPSPYTGPHHLEQCLSLPFAWKWMILT